VLRLDVLRVLDSSPRELGESVSRDELVLQFLKGRKTAFEETKDQWIASSEERWIERRTIRKFDF